VKVGGSARLQGSELQGPLLARLPDGSVALVDRCASGDEAAWRELHDTYRPVVVRFLRRMGLDAFEAADGAQEVFIQVHRYLWRFEGRSDLKTWLYKLCLSRATRLHRRKRVQRTIAALFGRAHEAPPAFGEKMHDAEARHLLSVAIARLKPIHRDVFVLFEIEGLSGEEVARVAGCPVATIWRRLHDARKELAVMLKLPSAEGGAA